MVVVLLWPLPLLALAVVDDNLVLLLLSEAEALRFAI